MVQIETDDTTKVQELGDYVPQFLTGAGSFFGPFSSQQSGRARWYLPSTSVAEAVAAGAPREAPAPESSRLRREAEGTLRGAVVLGLSLASAGPFVVWVGRVGGTPVLDIHLQTLRRRLLDAVPGGMVAKKREAKTSQPFFGARTVMLGKGGSS